MAERKGPTISKDIKKPELRGFSSRLEEPGPYQPEYETLFAELPKNAELPKYYDIPDTYRGPKTIDLLTTDPEGKVYAFPRKVPVNSLTPEEYLQQLDLQAKRVDQNQFMEEGFKKLELERLRDTQREFKRNLVPLFETQNRPTIQGDMFGDRPGPETPHFKEQQRIASRARGEAAKRMKKFIKKGAHMLPFVGPVLTGAKTADALTPDKEAATKPSYWQKGFADLPREARDAVRAMTGGDEKTKQQMSKDFSKAFLAWLKSQSEANKPIEVEDYIEEIEPFSGKPTFRKKQPGE